MPGFNPTQPYNTLPTLPPPAQELETRAIWKLCTEARVALAELKQVGELFGKDVRTINEHIKNLFSEGDLVSEATIRNFRIVRQEGAREMKRQIEHYNLDVIISVGYRVKSQQGTRFRQWATRILREHLTLGWKLRWR